MDLLRFLLKKPFAFLCHQEPLKSSCGFLGKKLGSQYRISLTFQLTFYGNRKDAIS